MPHGLSFSLMPRIYMAIAQEDRFPSPTFSARRPIFPRTANGPCSCAITTSSRSRWSPTSSATISGRPTPPTARAHQSRDPAPLGLVDGQRPPQDRVDELAAAVVSRHADPLLRRRDRHGRQHLSRRSQRVRTPMQWTPDRNGGLPLRPGPPLPADDHGPGLRLRGGQCRGTVPQPGVPPELDQAADLGAQEPQCVRPGIATFIRPANRSVLVCPAIRERRRAVRGQPVALGPGGGDRPVALARPRSVRAAGRTAFPAIGETPYIVTLAPYGFFWFLLTERTARRSTLRPRRQNSRRSSCRTAGVRCCRDERNRCWSGMSFRLFSPAALVRRAREHIDAGAGRRCDYSGSGRSRSRAGPGRSQGQARNGNLSAAADGQMDALRPGASPSERPCGGSARTARRDVARRHGGPRIHLVRAGESSEVADAGSRRALLRVQTDRPAAAVSPDRT